LLYAIAPVVDVIVVLDACYLCVGIRKVLTSVQSLFSHFATTFNVRIQRET